MTPLTRILELFATSDRVHLELTKFGPKSFFLRLNDLDDTNATAVGETLEQVARGGELAAIHQGLITEPCPRTEPPATASDCTHGITFDEEAARDLSAWEVRKRWPRLMGVCPLGCGYSGIYYASCAHYTYGDW